MPVVLGRRSVCNAVARRQPAQYRYGGHGLRLSGSRIRIGGIPEMIDHLQNGYVAESRSSADLAKGIEEILFSENYFYYSTQARLKVQQSYAEPYIARQYMDLYQILLDKKYE